MNKMKIVVDAKEENVAVVRVAVATFVAKYNVNLEELVDIKTAVSEAVTNSIIHGYDKIKGEVCVEVTYKNKILMIKVEDNGAGIENIDLALTPSFTTKPELEHSGMGFTIMQSFMDDMYIESKKNKGTIVTMTKKLEEIK